MCCAEGNPSRQVSHDQWRGLPGKPQTAGRLGRLEQLGNGGHGDENAGNGREQRRIIHRSPW